jgi:Polypeptide deformylase
MSFRAVLLPLALACFLGARAIAQDAHPVSGQTSFMKMSRSASPDRKSAIISVSPSIRAGDDRNLSELLQHEIDHLDGILAVDRITDIKTLCTREEFEKRYRAASSYAVAPAAIKS